MGEAALPVLRRLRGSRGRPDGPAASDTVGDHSADAGRASEAWRRQRVEAFSLVDDSRLLQSYRLATLVMRDRDEAEDATQEAIERAWSSWATLRDTGRFDAWFDRILVNVCRNRMRHIRTIRLLPLDDALDLAAADAHEGTATRLSLEPAFVRLSPDQRIIVVLRYWRDLSIEEIAERLGIPAGTVKSRLHYALRTLRAAIESGEEVRR